jgi:A/G-specific adenine glycosylase
MTTDLTRLRAAVLEWYRPRRHAYAWRRGRRNAYRTLVSEVMLQQTQAARVEPIFEAFVTRFPRVDALASASRADVLRAWSGLGYNRRAVALHESARAVVRDHGGHVPRNVDALVRLPGVGPYTAAAVASIGYGDPVAALDGNVRRVAARAVRGAEPDEVPAADLVSDAQAWLDPTAPGDWNQAIMDIGRLYCRPAPRCEDCPLAPRCRFRGVGRAGRPSGRRQSRFEGSPRQVRGAVVRELRSVRSATAGALAERTGHTLAAVVTATAALTTEGIIERTRSGRFRLPHR